MNDVKKIKDSFDRRYPEAKMVRELEVDRAAHQYFKEKIATKTFSLVYFSFSVFVFFIYWKYLELNIFLSILLGLITFFVGLTLLEILILKALGIKRKLRELNDEEILRSVQNLEKSGVSADDLIK